MPNILIMEDNKDCRELYKDRLLFEKWNVVAVDSANKALDMIRNNHYHPDLILLDLMLPGMSGQEFLEKIKSDSETNNITVIVVTAMILSQNQEEKLLGKADELIYKADILPGDLARKIKGLLSSKKLITSV